MIRAIAGAPVEDHAQALIAAPWISPGTVDEYRISMTELLSQMRIDT
jgi:hypothetical protein